jgi:hypothetical protein
MVTESKSVTQVWLSGTGQPMPSRSVSGLTQEERQKVRAGEVVLVRSAREDDGALSSDYLQAVWSGGKIRSRKPAAVVLEAWCRQQDERLAQGLAEVRRSAKDKTYWVLMKRITTEYACIPIRAPSADAAEHAARRIACNDWRGEVEREIKWKADDLPEFAVFPEETEATKDLPQFIVHADGGCEEVQTHD